MSNQHPPPQPDDDDEQLGRYISDDGDLYLLTNTQDSLIVALDELMPPEAREKEQAMLSRISVIQGDITKQQCDAIVNAANSTLLGGGGVDGAIHDAAGPQLLEECRQLHGCNTGEAKITKGYQLPARFVIHTVGPIWHGGTRGEDELLANCYRNSLALAEQHGVRTIAFPAISTGIYGFPRERAADIALREVKLFLEMNRSMEKILLVCFAEDSYQCHLQAMKKYF